MAKRKNIILTFTFNNSTNSGIVNYLFSLIKALNLLDDKKKPFLKIYYSKDAPINLIKTENYPYISYNLEGNEDKFLIKYYKKSTDIISRGLNKISKVLTTKTIISRDFFFPYEADYIFPFPNHLKVKQSVFWLVDFNPYYFPDHLSKTQREDYFTYVKNIVYSKNKVVLSSYDILKDLKKFHPNYTCKTEILRFAALLPHFDFINSDLTLKKYNIKEPYFMTPNQFWVHKNHIVLLKAALILKAKNINFTLVFTGSTNVESESSYYPSLIKFVRENNLDTEIKFLGVVDRLEQLVLMKKSLALVQPSLFEGWSTLVEENKALNKYIVLSDLPVHREQINFNCEFFDPHNEIQLANVLENLLVKGASVIPYDYNLDIKKYAERIVEIFS